MQTNLHPRKNSDLLTRQNLRLARSRWGKQLGAPLEGALGLWSRELRVSVANGDLLLLEGKWYITHAGLLRLARRKKCCGIHVELAPDFCDPRGSRWACRATVYKFPNCKGFVGYGDADPSNVDAIARGAELRIAETRAVSRALRKAYGIGMCSVEEIGSFAGHSGSAVELKKISQPANGNGNYGGRTVRDRLCQVIRQHQLDATLVKSYATDFCGVKTLRDATREQVENFVVYLADWAQKDRNALLCQLNSYLGKKESGAA